MADFRIGNAKIAFDEVRKIKSDVKVDDDNLKAQLGKDGLDEVIFRQGDDLFVAYKKNANFDNLKLNMDKNDFSIDDAYNSGQLSRNGDAVQVLFVDDENKDSFWVAPFKTVGRGVKSMVNDPFGKAAILGFVGGAITTITGRHLNINTSYSGVAENATHLRVFRGTLIGTGVGAALGGLKAGAENDVKDQWDTGIGLAAAAGGYGAGALTGWGGDELVTLAKNNPKVAAIAGGVTAAVVGTGIALDLLSDNDKPANYRAINRITEKPSNN